MPKQQPTPKQILFQVNAAPGSATAEQAWAQACAAAGDDVLAAVFFYFDGVEHAARGAPHNALWTQLGVPLLICQSAWQRRHHDQPNAAFRRGSLTDLVLWLERVDQVLCFGGGAPCGE